MREMEIAAGRKSVSLSPEESETRTFCLENIQNKLRRTKQFAHGPEFMLVKGFVICTDEKGLDADTSLQQILRMLSFSSMRSRNHICDELSAHHESCSRRGNQSWVV
jgi:hypothetical protein